MIGPGLDNKDSSKAALVRRGMEAFGGSVVMVGDRRFDIEGGRANGVDTVGVCYGYGTEEELVSADATHIAHTVEELTDILIGDAPRARGVFISMEGWTAAARRRSAPRITGRILHKHGLWRGAATREPGERRPSAEEIRALLLDPANQDHVRRDGGAVSMPPVALRACARGGPPGARARRRGRPVRPVCRFLRRLSGRGARSWAWRQVAAAQRARRRRHAARISRCCICASTRRRGAFPQAAARLRSSDRLERAGEPTSSCARVDGYERLAAAGTRSASSASTPRHEHRDR